MTQQQKRKPGDLDKALAKYHGGTMKKLTDKERLDWFHAHPDRLYFNRMVNTWGLMGGTMPIVGTLRQAIDAAIRAQRKGRKNERD